jgi:hypothetical protein
MHHATIPQAQHRPIEALLAPPTIPAIVMMLTARLPFSAAAQVSGGRLQDATDVRS